MDIVRVKGSDGTSEIGHIEVGRSGEYTSLTMTNEDGDSVALALDESEIAELIGVLASQLAKRVTETHLESGK